MSRGVAVKQSSGYLGGISSASNVQHIRHSRTNVSATRWEQFRRMDDVRAHMIASHVAGGCGALLDATWGSGCVVNGSDEVVVVVL